MPTFIYVRTILYIVLLLEILFVFNVVCCLYILVPNHVISFSERFPSICQKSKYDYSELLIYVHSVELSKYFI